MQYLPQQIDFESLAIRPSEIEKVTVLRQTEAHIVCRLACKHGSYILKWFDSPTSPVELHTYSLLEKYGVDTLPVYKRTDQALLVEDIQFSSSWRLANQSDMEQAVTGRAVAEWYQSFHRAGREALKEPNLQPSFLCAWVSWITQPSLMSAGTVFELQDKPVWATVIGCIESLKAKYLALPQTFNYNDFAAENLALSRGKEHSLRAIVFDYDCFAIGVAYSDWRNVMNSLCGAAKTSFEEVYGPISEKERLLDEPLAILYGLVVASQRSKTPKWVAPLIETVANGELERSISKALEV